LPPHTTSSPSAPVSGSDRRADPSPPYARCEARFAAQPRPRNQALTKPEATSPVPARARTSRGLCRVGGQSGLTGPDLKRAYTTVRPHGVNTPPRMIFVPGFRGESPGSTEPFALRRTPPLPSSKNEQPADIEPQFNLLAPVLAWLLPRLGPFSPGFPRRRGRGGKGPAPGTGNTPPGAAG